MELPTHCLTLNGDAVEIWMTSNAVPEAHPTYIPVEMLNLNPGQFVLLNYNFDTMRSDSSEKIRRNLSHHT